MKARQTMGEAVAELSQAWQALVFELRTALGLVKPTPTAPRFTIETCPCNGHPLIVDAEDATRQLPVFAVRDARAEARAISVRNGLNHDPDAELVGPGLYWERRTR